MTHLHDVGRGSRLAQVVDAPADLSGRFGDEKVLAHELVGVHCLTEVSHTLHQEASGKEDSMRVP